MASGQGDIRMKIHMTGREYVDFLNKLATDDSFREALRKDPLETLKVHNIHVDPDDLPSTIVLPSKEGLQAHLAELEAKGSDIAFISFPMFLFPRE